MPAYMLRAVLHTTDNIPANFVQNQFCVDVTGEDIDPGALLTAIQTFYRARVAMFPGTIAQTGHDLKIYDLPGVQPNYPQFELTWSFSSAPSGTAGPSELSTVLSFQGQRSPGFPQARRRGRIYLGPLVATLTDTPRPENTLLSAIAGDAIALWEDINDIPGHTWCVWSAASQDAVPIVGGFQDDAWDIQRRRGLAPANRYTWTPPV